MSPSVGNFVHDLVEMAKAMEQLPQLQSELDRAHADIETYAKQVQRLEMQAIERKAEIDSLHQKVREAEAARDSAEMMFLECDDKLSAFRRLVTDFTGNAESLRKAQEPPAPTTNVSPAPSVQPVETAQPAPTDAPQVNPYANEPVSNPFHNYDPGPAIGPLGPTAEPSAGQSDAASPHAPVEAATTTGTAGEGVSVSAPPTPAPSEATGTGTENVASGSDPEPMPRYTTAWYDWRDRQQAKVVKPKDDYSF